MAIDTRLPLAVSGPRDISQVFNNALLNAQGVRNLQTQREQQPLRNRLLEAQTGTAEAQLTQQQQLNRFQSVAFGAAEILPDLRSGNFEGVARKLQARRSQLLANNPNADTTQTDEAIGLLSTDPQKLLANVNQVIGVAQQQGILKAPVGASGLASAKTEIFEDGTIIQALPDKTIQVTNPIGEIVTGQERLDTLKASTKFGLDIKRQEADIAVGQAERTAEATQRAQRVSKITTELSERNRTSKRAAINLSQAATLVEKAQQGVAGATKVRLAKLFPDIDVGSEAALSQSLTNLALDELQKFKGPTTDFEFQKTEQIAGTLGDSRSANRAKVASLQRANWFVQREFKQFQDHIKAGKSPDTFGFNFGEQIKTKKGEFSLQDLQDTAVSNNISIDETLKRLNR